MSSKKCVKIIVRVDELNMATSIKAGVEAQRGESDHKLNWKIQEGRLIISEEWKTAIGGMGGSRTLYVFNNNKWDYIQPMYSDQ